MAVKLLVSASDVRERMSLPAGDDVDTAIERAIPTAQATVANILETPFDVVTGVEAAFYLDENRFPRVPEGYFRLRLQRGFVESVTPTYGTKLAEADTALASQYYRLDAQKGILHVNELWKWHYVKVTYNAGIASASAAPDWLKDAIISLVPTVMNHTQLTNRSDEAEELYKSNTKTVNEILQLYSRGRAFQFRSLY